MTARDLEAITLGELEALPLEQQKIIRRALINRCLERMHAKYEAYLDGDYTSAGELRNTWAE